ncbi:uncharacterized protein IWZ02DRAFT_37544 [Phyllosticta citriasiana]|uniref:Secreted protein n=1 Tax=Phyllosticta citriasiana TaxID=595635 RepID=A0ABR1K9B2_9PEZI
MAGLHCGLRRCCDLGFLAVIRVSLCPPHGLVIYPLGDHWITENRLSVQPGSLSGTATRRISLSATSCSHHISAVGPVFAHFVPTSGVRACMSALFRMFCWPVSLAPYQRPPAFSHTHLFTYTLWTDIGQICRLPRPTARPHAMAHMPSFITYMCTYIHDVHVHDRCQVISAELPTPSPSPTPRPITSISASHRSVAQRATARRSGSHST